MGIQQILSIGALAIFTFVVLTFSSSSNVQYDSSNFNEAVIVATGIGESFIEKIQKKAFDENTVSTAFSSTDSLTIVNNLGYDTGESAIETFDDIDDFDDFDDDSIEYTNKLGSFEIEISVYYINKLNPDVASVTPTFLKRFDIHVSNTYLAFTEGSSETLSFSGIISY